MIGKGEETMRENNRMFFHEDYVLGNIINLITPFLKNLFKFLQSVARFFVFDIYIYIYMALGHLMVISVVSGKNHYYIALPQKRTPTQFQGSFFSSPIRKPNN